MRSGAEGAGVLAAANSGSGISDGTITVTADVDDATGNSATQAVSTLIQDTVDPTMTITSATVSSGASTTTAAVVLVYTASQATSNFVIGDITATNCNNAAFTTTSTTVYGSTCTVASDATPTVLVAAEAFTDAAANGNGAASNTYTWTQDDTGPTMTITSNTVASGATTGTADVVLILTSNEATTDFVIGDVTATGGDGCTKSAWSATSSTIYGVTCTPDDSGDAPEGSDGQAQTEEQMDVAPS